MSPRVTAGDPKQTFGNGPTSGHSVNAGIQVSMSCRLPRFNAYSSRVVSRLIERDDQLAILQDVLSAPVDHGRTVLLSGQTGNGKTSLVNAWLKGLDHRFRVLMASCEPVGIPAAFAPLYEIADQLPKDLCDAITSGSGRQSVNLGMLDVLKNDRVVLVFEDMHWADEGTLGLVRFLGRRIGATNSCLIVTYRSEELDLNPPLRLVVADLGPTAVRIELPTLTRAGVEQMASGLDID